MMKGFICKKTMHVIRAVMVIELHFAVGSAAVTTGMVSP
jgi:hypothetical protein